jgi:hypothetical protein
MPGIIKQKKQSESYATSSVMVVTLSSEIGNETYVVSYTTYPPELAKMMQGTNPDVIFGFSRDKLLKGISGLRVVNERAISLNGYPGKEIVYGGPALIFLRAYWALPNFYVVMALRENPTGSAPSGPPSRVARSFVNSFEILSDAGNTLTGKQYEPEMPPFLNLDDRLFLGRELMKRGYSEVQAARWIFDVMKKGVSYLTPSEKDELKLLHDQAYSILSLEEAADFEAIERRFEQGAQSTKAEERLTNDLIRKALESLPPTKLARYQFLIGKGIRAALAAK